MSRILIVEADRVLAQNLMDFFQARDFDVDWRFDLQAAIDCADRNCPDLVLLDLILCGRSGVEFLYEFRSYPDWQEVPVVIYSQISSRDLGGSISGFEHLNVAAYHSKSETSLKDLQNTIEQLLSQPATA